MDEFGTGPRDQCRLIDSYCSRPYRCHALKAKNAAVNPPRLILLFQIPLVLMNADLSQLLG